MFVKGILGGTTFSHTFGYNQFDEESLRIVKNVTLNDGETIEINDIEVKFEAKESKEETTSATEESVESMTRSSKRICLTASFSFIPELKKLSGTYNILFIKDDSHKLHKNLEQVQVIRQVYQMYALDYEPESILLEYGTVLA